MASSAEEFLLKLTQQVSGPAAEASGALGQLEAMIASERAALGRLEEKLTTASAKLQALGSAGASSKAIEKQTAAVAALQAQLAQQGEGIAALEALRGQAAEVDAVAAASAAAAAAAAQLAAEESAAAAAARDLAAAAAEVAAAEAAEDAATEAKFASLTATYQQAEAERKLADAAKAAAGALKDEARAAAQASKGAAEMGKSLPTGQVNVLGEAFGRLGGPIGQAGQKVFGTIDAIKKMGVAGGSSFAIAAVAAVAFVAVLAGVVAGLYKITSQLIEWADTTGQLAKLQDKFSKNLKDTFGGAVKIDGFLGKLETLVALFDKSTVSGKALQFITGLIFQPLIDMATAAIPYIERAFIVLVTWALKAYVAVKQFAASDVGQGLITGLKILAVVLGVVIAVAAVGAALIALPFILLTAAVVAVVAAMGWVVNQLGAAWSAISGAASSAWAAVTGAGQSALDWIMGVPAMLASIGANMMSSLAGAITGAAGAVLGAITGAVGGAIDAAKALLGISSPSKVFATMGMQMGAGLEVGTEKATAGVQESVTAMVAPPSLASPKAPSKGEKASTGPSFTFSNCVFGEGVSEEKLEGWLTAIFERNQLAVGVT